MRKVIAFVVIAMGPLALGATVIREWSGYYQPDDHFRVDAGVVTILHGSDPNIPWKFEAYDSDTGAPGDIDAILIQPTGTVGVIRLNVIGDPAYLRVDGAANVGTIDLVTDADADNSIDQLDITGDFGQFGWMLAHDGGTLSIGANVVNDIDITQGITGPVTIGGVLRANLSAATMRDVTVGGIAYPGGIHVSDATAGYANTILVLDSMNGFVAIDGPCSGMIHIVEWLLDLGNVTLAGPGPHKGTIQVGLSVNVHATVSVPGALIGRVEVGGHCLGAVSIGHLQSTPEAHGTVNVAYDLVAPGWIAATSEFGAGSEIHIEGDLTGTVEVNADSFAPAEGNITVGGSLLGSVSAPGGLEAAGTLRVGDVASTGVITLGTRGTYDPPPLRLAGKVLVDGNMAGLIKVWGAATGSIVVGGSLYGLSDSNHEIWVLGSLRNPGEFPPPDPTELTGGYIIINGSFGQPPPGTQQGFIHLGDMLGSTTFVTVNYDGIGAENDGDQWRQGSTIEIGYTPYSQNTPEKRLWEVKCKADMNNDHLIDFSDIDPFVQALSDPPAYSKAYPGLGGTYWDGYDGGSRVWHGDLNCDGALDFLDIDPFVVRLTEGCCLPTCVSCFPPGDGLSPQQLAVELRVHTAPQRYGDLVTLAGTAAHALPDPDRRAYWHAVYAALTR